MIRPRFCRVGGLGRKRGRCVVDRTYLTVSKSSNAFAFLSGSAIIVVDTRTKMMPNAMALAAFPIVAFVILDAVF